MKLLICAALIAGLSGCVAYYPHHGYGGHGYYDHNYDGHSGRHDRGDHDRYYNRDRDRDR